MPIVNNIKPRKEVVSNLVKFLLKHGIEGQRLNRPVDTKAFYPPSPYYVLVYHAEDDSYCYKLSPYALQILNDV